MAAPGRGQPVEAGLQIDKQVVDGLEADVKAQDRTRGIEGRRRAHRAAGADEALETTPGGADAEKLQAVHHGLDLLGSYWLQHDGEQPRGAGKIAPPKGMTRIGG